jgi:hypothetical protein
MRIIYAGATFTFGGSPDVASSGQAGQFLLVVNTSDDEINVGGNPDDPSIPSTCLINGSLTYYTKLNAYNAQLYVCCGQAGGYTSWMSISSQENVSVSS